MGYANHLRFNNTSIIQTRFARSIVFDVMNVIFQYDVVLISLKYDKIITYIFQAKDQIFLFYFKYLVILYIHELQNFNLAHFQFKRNSNTRAFFK